MNHQCKPSIDERSATTKSEACIIENDQTINPLEFIIRKTSLARSQNIRLWSLFEGCDDVISQIDNNICRYKSITTTFSTCIVSPIDINDYIIDQARKNLQNKGINIIDWENIFIECEHQSI